VSIWPNSTSTRLPARVSGQHEADEPDVVLRIVENPMVFGDKFVPPIVAMLDLLDAADTRAAAEALRVLR
jgi:hypothetical protein